MFLENDVKRIRNVFFDKLKNGLNKAGYIYLQDGLKLYVVRMSDGAPFGYFFKYREPSFFSSHISSLEGSSWYSSGERSADRISAFTPVTWESKKFTTPRIRGQVFILFFLGRAREGKTVEEVMTLAAGVLTRNDVMEGVADMIDLLQIEAVFTDGSRLVSIHKPIK